MIWSVLQLQTKMATIRGEFITVKVHCDIDKRSMNHHSRITMRTYQNDMYRFEHDILMLSISPLSIVLSFSTGFAAYYAIISSYRFDDTIWMILLVWSVIFGMIIFVAIIIGCLHDLYHMEQLQKCIPFQCFRRWVKFVIFSVGLSFIFGVSMACIKFIIIWSHILFSVVSLLVFTMDYNNYMDLNLKVMI